MQLTEHLTAAVAVVTTVKWLPELLVNYYKSSCMNGRQHSAGMPTTIPFHMLIVIEVDTNVSVLLSESLINTNKHMYCFMSEHIKRCIFDTLLTEAAIVVLMLFFCFVCFVFFVCLFVFFLLVLFLKFIPNSPSSYLSAVQLSKL